MSTASPIPPSGLTVAERHRHFLRQANWTRPLRNQLYRRCGLLNAETVVDVGCGTGAVTEEVAARTRGRVLGVDRDAASIAFARRAGTAVAYQVADACHLPFAAGEFQVVHSHFLLLWVADPARAVREMWRVCRPGGYVVVCAEPDYGGRIDFPPEIAIGRLQVESLRREGADPYAGRRLRELFRQAGAEADVGVLASVWTLAQHAAEFADEWRFLEVAARGLLPPDELARLRGCDRLAIESGVRLSFLPIFYALARKAS